MTTAFSLNPINLYRCAMLATAAALLSACSATNWNDGPPTAAPAARSQAPAPTEQAAAVDLPRSKRGNPPFYEVYGVRYSVMNSSTNYREKGVASWYGKKFHGRETSSGERYDMYAMTAAHKTLPLPTNVRVTNLTNGKSIIVRVNDRGPFVKNRLIDLSYSAALELDVVANGTAMVEVVALNSAYKNSAGQPVSAQAGKSVTATTPGTAPASIMYLQVGAFGEYSNAKNLVDKLSSNGISNVMVHEINNGVAPLFKVRIGPLSSVSQYDQLSDQVGRLQIAESHLVVESDDDVSTQAANTVISGG